MLSNAIALIFIFSIFIGFSNSKSLAQSITDAPPEPPKISEKQKAGRPPHFTAIVFLDAKTLEDQSQFVKIEGSQEQTENDHYFEALKNIGEKLKAEGLMKRIQGQDPRSQVWWLEERFRDLRVGYHVDYDGTAGLVLGFPIGMDFYDKGFRLDMLDDDSHQIFRRILSDFKSLFIKSHNPILRGTVTFGETAYHFNFRFITTYSDLKVQLLTDQNSPAKSFLQELTPTRFCSALFKR